MNDAVKMKGKREDYIKTFSSEEGKKVLADLEDVCLFKSPTFNKDSHVMAFQEGLRAVYLHINTIINTNIEELENIINSNKGGE